ncbi:MAG: DMT family transporter [Planctomycetota bacterium]
MATASRYRSHLVLLGLVAIWGGSYAIVKSAVATVPPFALLVVRFGFAVACLLPLAMSARDAGSRFRTSALPGSAAGVLLAIGYSTQTVGMVETSASLAGILAGLIPLLVALGGWWFLGSAPGRLGLIGLAVGFCGLGFLIWPSAPAAGEAADTPRGIVLQIISAISYTAHVLLLSRFGARVSPVHFCVWQLSFVVAAGLVSGAVFEPGALATVEWTPRFLLQIAYLGGLATAFAIAVQGQVQHRIPPAHVAILFAAQPLFAAVFGAAFLGDRLGPLRLIGGGLVIVGIVCSAFDEPRAVAGKGQSKK